MQVFKCSPLTDLPYYGHSGEYWRDDAAVQTELNEVHTRSNGQYFPVQLEQAT